MAIATFGAGCFWGVEAEFRRVKGVMATAVGYSGGDLKNPTYKDVCSDATGHAEVVQVEYDPKKVSYAQLVEVFWRNIDPTQKDGQFCDHGSQYRSAIFYHDEEQRRVAEAARAALRKNRPFKGEIVTEVTKSSEFYPAEGYHQNFYLKNPTRYKFYKSGCGREARLRQLWGRGG